MLPLSVWLCPDTTDENANENGKQKTPVCLRHRQGVGLELARHLITACTREGDLVTEAYTSNEATLVAAAELGRRAIACVPNLPLAQHIGGRLRDGFPPERLAGLAMRPCRPDQMVRGLADHLDEVSLVVAALPPYRGDAPAGRTSRSGGCPSCRSDKQAVTDQQLGAFLLAAWRVLRRGGHLAVITTARHAGDRLIDPAPQIIRQARVFGFRYTQHVIALRVPVHGDELLVQAGPAGTAQLRDVRSRALPPAVSVHADVCILAKPRTAARSKGATR